MLSLPQWNSPQQQRRGLLRHYVFTYRCCEVPCGLRGLPQCCEMTLCHAMLCQHHLIGDVTWALMGSQHYQCAESQVSVFGVKTKLQAFVNERDEYLVHAEAMTWRKLLLVSVWMGQHSPSDPGAWPGFYIGLTLLGFVSKWPPGIMF